MGYTLTRWEGLDNWLEIPSLQFYKIPTPNQVKNKVTRKYEEQNVFRKVLLVVLKSFDRWAYKVSFGLLNLIKRYLIWRHSPRVHSSSHQKTLPAGNQLGGEAAASSAPEHTPAATWTLPPQVANTGWEIQQPALYHHTHWPSLDTCSQNWPGESNSHAPEKL